MDFWLKLDLEIGWFLRKESSKVIFSIVVGACATVDRSKELFLKVLLLFDDVKLLFIELWKAEFVKNGLTIEEEQEEEEEEEEDDAGLLEEATNNFLLLQFFFFRGDWLKIMNF